MGIAMNWRCPAAIHMLFCLTTFIVLLMRVRSQETMRYVTSFDQLQRATNDGVRIVVVTDHLHLPSPHNAGTPGQLLTLQDSTEAILGMCDTPPPPNTTKLGAPVRPGDCVLTVSDHFITVPHSPTTSRWLDHLYIKVDAPVDTFQDPLKGGTVAALVKHEGGDLYMSNCTFDGHGNNLRAVEMSTKVNNAATQLYTDECTIMQFTSDKAAAVSMGANTSAAFHRSNIVQNTIKALAPGNANGQKQQPHPLGAAVVAGQHSTLLIDDCMFRNNLVEASGGSSKPGATVAANFGLPLDISDDVAAVSVASEVKVFANPERRVFDNSIRKSRAAMYWNSADDFSISSTDFEQFSSEISSYVEASKIHMGAISALPEDSPTSNGGDNRYVVTALAAVFAGVMLTSLVATAFALHWWRKSKSRREGKQCSSSGSFRRSLVLLTSSRASEASEKGLAEQASGFTHTIPTWLSPDSNAAVPLYGGSQVSMNMSGNNGSISFASDLAPATSVPSAASGAVPQQRVPTNTLAASCAVVKKIAVPNYNESTRAFGTTGTESTKQTFVSARNAADSRTMSLTSVGAATAACGDGAEKVKKVLEETLDLLVATGTPFLLQYVMEGPVRWRLGSRGAVQFATSRLTGEQVAIKFFVDGNAFRCEQAASTQPQLRKYMESLIMMEPAQKVQPMRKPIIGDALPACVVYERGEPLDEWCARIKPDILTVLHVLCSVAQRVADLHASGFAHRDIKPANIMLQPSTLSWTLVDYGCAAPFGYLTSLTDCRVYVPPEALSKLESKQACRSVTVDTSVDVWALGVVALETLSGSASAAAFAPVDTKATNACDTRTSQHSSLASSRIHGEFERSMTVSVCNETHDDHATHVTQQLFAQLSQLNLSRLLSAAPSSAVTSALSVLRMRIAASIAREPEQRPTIKHVLSALQRARDELQTAHACTGPSLPKNSRIPSYDSLLSPSSVVPSTSSHKQKPPQQRTTSPAPAESCSKPYSTPNGVATGKQTPTYMPASPEVTYVHDAAEVVEPREGSGVGADNAQRAQRAKRAAKVKAQGPSLAPEALAAQSKVAGKKQVASVAHACTPKVSRGENTPTYTPSSPNGTPLLIPASILPLDVTTDSGVNDSPDSLNWRPSNFKLSQKDTRFAVASSASDCSSVRSHAGMSSISGTQQKIRSKPPPLQTVTSGIETSGNSPGAQYRTAAEALVQGLSSNRASQHLRLPPPLTSKRLTFDTFGVYTHAPHARSEARSETSITPTLSPRSLTPHAQQSTCEGERLADTPMHTDTPSGGQTPQSPRSPCGHIKHLESMDYRLQGDARMTPPSSFEAIEDDMRELDDMHELDDTHSPADSFWSVPAILAASRQREHACEVDEKGKKIMTTPSGGILRPSAFRTITETETSVTADESTQFAGITINMEDHALTEVSSGLQREGASLAASQLCRTPSFGKRQAGSMHGQETTLRTSSFTNRLMSEG